jgi:hypothetical protein
MSTTSDEDWDALSARVRKALAPIFESADDLAIAAILIRIDPDGAHATQTIRYRIERSEGERVFRWVGDSATHIRTREIPKLD